MNEISKEAVDLKPCPFCGGDVEKGYFAEEFVINCPSCRYEVSTYDDSEIDPSIKGICHWNSRSDAQAARIEELEAQCVTVKPLEWSCHPDGIEFYALDNDDGDCLYVVHQVEDETDWRVSIGRDPVMQEDETDLEMWWPNADRAKAYVQADFNSRMRRILAAITTQSADDVWDAAIEAAAGVVSKETRIMYTGNASDFVQYRDMTISERVSAISALKRNKGEG